MAAGNIPNILLWTNTNSKTIRKSNELNYFVDIDTTFDQKIMWVSKSQFEKYKQVGFDVSKNLKLVTISWDTNCKYARVST